MTDIEKLEALRNAAPDYIDLEMRGRPYMQYEEPADECKAFYKAAHEALPDLLAELKALRAGLKEACEIGQSWAGRDTDDGIRLAELAKLTGGE